MTTLFGQVYPFQETLALQRPNYAEAEMEVGTGRWSCFWRRFPTRPAAACWWCSTT